MEKITETEMNFLAMYMHSHIRERLHMELAPCTPEKFIEEYLKEDQEFETVLRERGHAELFDL